MSELHVITTYWNPLGYRSRRRLYEQFRDRMAADGVALHTVELATRADGFEVTSASDPLHIQLVSPDQLWRKENLVNIAIRGLPADWRFVAWLDADIAFSRRDWAAETLRQLERHAFVQMFTHFEDLGPNDEPLKAREGFVYSQRAGAAALGQPGGAWAARREALEAVGGLIDWSILGSNDYFMALGLIGAIQPETTRMPGSNYAASLLDWQEKCRGLTGDLGWVDTRLLHAWHGSKADRGYDTRWKILVDNNFDPDLDLVRDDRGLLGFSGRNPVLREQIEAYFLARNEDGVAL